MTIPSIGSPSKDFVLSIGYEHFDRMTLHCCFDSSPIFFQLFLIDGFGSREYNVCRHDRSPCLLFDYKHASEIEPVYIKTRNKRAFAALHAVLPFINEWAFLLGSTCYFRDETIDHFTRLFNQESMARSTDSGQIASSFGRTTGNTETCGCAEKNSIPARWATRLK